MDFRHIDEHRAHVHRLKLNLLIHPNPGKFQWTKFDPTLSSLIIITLKKLFSINKFLCEIISKIFPTHSFTQRSVLCFQGQWVYLIIMMWNIFSPLYEESSEFKVAEFRSKCSVGTAGRNKISNCWLPKSNTSFQILYNKFGLN